MHAKRLFLGIPLSPELKKRLRRECEGWENLPFFVVPEENLHITLLFLGFVDEADVEEICEEIETACEKKESFEILFDRISLVPNVDDPTMVWLSGTPSIALKDLRQALELSLGYRVPERKSFRPHVNLARVRRNRYRELPEKPILEKKVKLVESVSSVHLLESISLDGKRRYESIFECPLD